MSAQTKTNVQQLIENDEQAMGCLAWGYFVSNSIEWVPWYSVHEVTEPAYEILYEDEEWVLAEAAIKIRYRVSKEDLESAEED